MSTVALELPVLAGTAERRYVSFDSIEMRDSGDKLEFVGHAAVFDRLSEDLGGFRERIQRGAFRKALDKDPDVRFLFNHDPNLVLARTTVAGGEGTLELREDPKGLLVTAQLVPTQLGTDMRSLTKSGVVSQMSFSFNVQPDGEDVWLEEDGELVRTIISFGRLFDVGPVTFPAYPQTDASMRSLVCGVAVIKEGEPQAEAVRELAWKIHRGEIKATVEERAALDALLAKLDTVSPWTAQRALLAVSSEPELLGAIPGKRAAVVLTEAAVEVPYMRLARKRRLSIKAKALR